MRIVVEIEGPGFSESVLPYTLEPFVHDEGDTFTRHEATGLGLAVGRAVAQAHDGSATAENLTSGGARITVVQFDRAASPSRGMLRAD